MAATMQDLLTVGLNPFAVQLVAESLLKSPLAERSATDPVRFAFPVNRADCAAWQGLYITLQAVRAGEVSAKPIEPLSQAALDVVAERRRQIEAEGWTAEHDDAVNTLDELAFAACCYCVADQGDAPPAVWPWPSEWWKPKDRRRNMVKAAALLLAAVEQRDRAALNDPGDESHHHHTHGGDHG